MADEAVITDPGETIAVDNSPAEAPVTPETPVVDNNDSVPQSGDTAPDNVSVYQDVVAKYNEDNTYEMSDAESDAFLDVQEQINNGMDEPPLKEDKAPEEKAPEAKDPIETPAIETNEDLTGDSVTDNMMDAMKKVGAKDVTELPAKIQGLIDNRDSSGGKLGSENVALKQTVTEYQTKETNQIKWLEDLKAGKPGAIDYLHNIVGYNPTSKSITPSTENADIGNTDDFIDVELAGVVNSQNISSNKKIADLEKLVDSLVNHDKIRTNEAHEATARNAWSDDIVELVTQPENAKYYGVSAKEARGLATNYYRKGNTDPIHPKFQKIHELIVFANTPGRPMPDLKTAHLIQQHESGQYAKALIAAQEEGQKQTTFKPTPNAALSDKQSRVGANIPDPTISEDTITKIEQGNFDLIPDNWMSEDGTLIPSKIPERFHTRVFGKAGKPR